MRILAISDLHTDFKKHRELIEGLPKSAYQDDCLIVAGDIAHSLRLIHDTLVQLRATFREVFFVPGNHELWVMNKEYHSIDKFMNILKLCDQLGVHVRPVKLDGVWIVPLFSWYHSAFSSYPHLDTSQLEGWMDFHVCRWPTGIDDLAVYFTQLNKPHLKAYDAPVISFSHFLPRPDLLPHANYLYFKALPEVAGSMLIEQQIRQLNSRVHVFGHSHINWDQEIDGVRYVQNALSRPRRVGFPVKVVWER